MKSFLDVHHLHHAYCILGERELIKKNLRSFFAKHLYTDIAGNPDVIERDFDTLDIEDARMIKNMHASKPAVSDRKLFVVSANFITEKAQNAMLKMFEEPRGDTHFFLVMPSAAGIIATLRSRLFMADERMEEKTALSADNFLSGSITKRLSIIKDLMEKVSDEEESKITVLACINGIEIALHKRALQAKDRSFDSLLERIETARRYAMGPSPSLKMILEYLALVIPLA